MKDTQTGLPCMGMNTCQPGFQEAHAMQPNKWTQHRINRCKNTAARRGDICLCTTAVSSVSMLHSNLKPNKTVAIAENTPKYLAAMQGERQTHATTLQTQTASFYTSMMNVLARAACTAQSPPKPISRSELSATRTFSFFPPKTTSIIFLLLLRASCARSLIGI